MESIFEYLGLLFALLAVAASIGTIGLVFAKGGVVRGLLCLFFSNTLFPLFVVSHWEETKSTARPMLVGFVGMYACAFLRSWVA